MSIGPIAHNWIRAEFIYSRLCNYTQQHTLWVLQRAIGLLRPALLVVKFISEILKETYGNPSRV